MTERTIARVVIAFDPVGENEASIAAAARLAASLDAALRGVFFEDEALLNLAAIPFIRHIGAGGETFASIDERTVLHQFAAHAARLRTMLEAAARSQSVGCTFDIVRGPSTIATLDIGEKDLLVIEAETRPFAGALHLDSRWLAAALETRHPFLLLRSSTHAPHDIVALVQTAAPAATRLITTAAQLALGGARSLMLLLADGLGPSAALDIVASVAPKLAARCRVERIAGSKRAIEQNATAGRLVIVDADPSVNDMTALKEILATTRADILFLR
jgi:hypothetical protein